MDGKNKHAKFRHPCGLCFDASDNSLLVCDCNNNKLRKVDKNGTLYAYYIILISYCPLSFLTILTGVVTTLCDIPTPTQVAIAKDRTILVSSHSTNQIFRVTREGMSKFLSFFKSFYFFVIFSNNNVALGQYQLSVLAGSGKEERLDGPRNECGLYRPYGIAVDEVSNCCFVTETLGCSVRRIKLT
jgi:hypothetical protein